MGKCCCLGILLCLPLVWSFGQTDEQHTTFKQALAAYQANQLEQSTAQLERLLEQYKQPDAFAQEICFLLAKSYEALGVYDRLAPLTEKMEAVGTPSEVSFQVWMRYFRGLIAITEGQQKKGMSAYQQALALAPVEDATYGDGVIPRIHNQLGYQFMETNQPDSALVHLEKAYELWQINPGVNAQSNIVDILINIARVYQNFFQSERALHYSRESLRSAAAYFGSTSAVAIEAAGNHALLLVQRDELAEALTVYQSIAPHLDKVELETQSAILSNWGLLYRNREAYEQALEKMWAAAAIDRGFLPEEDPGYIGTLINIAGIYFQTGRVQEVLPILYEADSLANLYGSVHQPTLIGAIGLTLSQLDRPQEALDYIQQALASATRTPEILPLSGWPNPPLDNFVVAAGSPHLDYLRFKTMALWNIYEADAREEYLQAAFDTYALLHDLLQKTFLYADIWQDNKLQTNLQFAMEGLLKTSYTLQARGASGRLDEVYIYLQQSKGLSIRVNTQKLQQSTDAELDSLESATIRAEQALFLAQRSPEPMATDSLEKKLLSLHDALEKRRAGLSAGFLEVPALSIVQETLTDSTLFLETYLTVDGLYTLGIGRNALSLFLGESPQTDLTNTILEMRRALSDWSYIRANPELAKQVLAREGQQLYQLLLAPAMEAFPEARQLIIAPNGALAALPYEVLLGQTSDWINQPYRNWPFLGRHLTMSYAYSASVWLDQQQRQRTPNKKYLAAFAPSYQEVQQLSPDSALANLQRSGAWNLPFAQAEAAEVCTTMDGDLYGGDQATKNKFWEVANRYRVLHLAMHGIAEQEEPEFSRLIFAGDSSATTPVLYANELYGRQLNADLVVLSACNTGWGGEVQSEGILSLGHAFSSAGVAATVITLWPVADAAGKQLVTDFYAQIRAGVPKSQALQMAKTGFLSKAAADLEGHPYFWAAYQLYGDATAVAKKGWPGYAWILLIGLVGLLVYVGWHFRAKKLSSSF